MTWRAWPRDECENALQDAWASEDDAKTLPTLARAVVCLPLPAEQGGLEAVQVRVAAPGSMRLPLLDGPAGPAVPVFSSYDEMVEACGTQASAWAQVPFGELLAQLSTEQLVVLNPGGHATALLRPEHLQRVARLVRAEPTLDAVRAGPTSRVRYGAPAVPQTAVLDAAARAAARHPDIASVHAGQGQIDEPGTQPFVVLGFRLRVVDATCALDDVAARIRAVSEAPVSFHVLDDARTAGSPALAWLAGQPPLLPMSI